MKQNMYRKSVENLKKCVELKPSYPTSTIEGIIHSVQRLCVYVYECVVRNNNKSREKNYKRTTKEIVKSNNF